MAHSLPPVERDDTLQLLWPAGAAAPRVELPPGYRLRAAIDRRAFVQVQASIGFAVTNEAWTTLVADLVDGAMTFATTAPGKEPAAVVTAERRPRGWVELGWVAVDPGHRGRRLGRAVCASVTERLLASGERRLFLSTQDHRLAALAIYLQLGFQPVLRAEKRERWRAVARQLADSPR